MKAKIVFSSILLCLFILVGCATTAGYRKQIDNWQGKNIKLLAQKWGLPNNIISLYDDNKVYVYQNSKLVYHTRYCTDNDCMPNTEYKHCTTWFEINNKNIITAISFRGEDCTAAE